jgi:hypothetical protein
MRWSMLSSWAGAHVGGDDPSWRLESTQRIEGVVETPAAYDLALQELQVVDDQHVDALEVCP